MGYGLYYFPAAPIRYVDRQYVDKQGGFHTRSDYERLRTWERVLLSSWIAAAVSTGLYLYANARIRRVSFRTGAERAPARSDDAS
jgi:hypothetical protein